MKFAKELDRGAVPEWRIKYLNYKAGKKYVKAVSRAINRTPRPPTGRASSFRPDHPERSLAKSHAPRRRAASVAGQGSQPPPSLPLRRHTGSLDKGWMEGEALTGDGNNLHYGSFVATPSQDPLARHDSRPQFALPAPALRSSADSPQLSRQDGSRRAALSKYTKSGHASSTVIPSLGSGTTSKPPAAPRPPSMGIESPLHLRRMLSHASETLARHHSRPENLAQKNDLVHERVRDFYAFMDSELDKVDTFYKQKEEQAGLRLRLLCEQLHEMRDRRTHELATRERPADLHRPRGGTDPDAGLDLAIPWVQPLRAKVFPGGPNSRALRSMARTPRQLGSTLSDADTRRDYSRKVPDQDVSYRTAKRKLKLALQEFYRGLELLKSYALLNRTAFRKLNKKFDKAAHARPPLRYLNDKVNTACFVRSDLLEAHIAAAEDLYARYFERGNRKLAAGKLRSLTRRASDESASSFLNGFLLGTGLVFSVQGTIYSSQLLLDDSLQLRRQTSFLLQIYAGYFLMLLIFALVTVDCFLWTRNKVNYQFIFELDPRSQLDWRRLAEFPCFFLLLIGLFMWMNFSRYGAESTYLYYPVVLIAITVAVIILPAPVLAWKSRQWFVYGHWRLLMAGLYPVEFRDFFLGDIYCSLSYSMANIELFFCLYANHWEEPSQCNSKNSRLLGFLTTLPPIWRFLQCLRRYKDTRNVFPHLVNGGKYSMTIISSMLLSIYRIDGTNTNLALYITFSLVNSIYVSIWDLFMDFSLLQTQSRNFCLRDILALKRKWPYYAIMAVDPVLRFAWIFYAIFTHNAQHSIISFIVGLVEILRRGAWALFRVENEHCANVSQYKASRDVPLPYRIEPLIDRPSAAQSPTVGVEAAPPQQPAPLASQASSTAVTSTFSRLRRRTDVTSGRTFSRILAEAHKQDFEKKRKPNSQEEGSSRTMGEGSGDDDDDGDDDDVEAEADNSAVREARVLRQRADDREV